MNIECWFKALFRNIKVGALVVLWFMLVAWNHGNIKSNSKYSLEQDQERVRGRGGRVGKRGKGKGDAVKNCDLQIGRAQIDIKVSGCLKSMVKMSQRNDGASEEYRNSGKQLDLQGTDDMSKFLGRVHFHKKNISITYRFPLSCHQICFEMIVKIWNICERELLSCRFTSLYLHLNEMRRFLYDFLVELTQIFCFSLRKCCYFTPKMDQKCAWQSKKRASM